MARHSSTPPRSEVSRRPRHRFRSLRLGGAVLAICALAIATALVVDPSLSARAARFVAQSPAAPAAPLASSDTGASGDFGSGPASGAITCNGKSNVTISGRTFANIRNDRPAITIRNCTNVVISDNDFQNDAEPIYVVNSKNVTISGNRYMNITGPHERNGSHRGNFTQWENSTGGSIVGNIGVGGDTEDVISLYKSGGVDAAHPLLVEDNVFEGTTWDSTSGSGILVGDNGGSHVVVRNNTLVNVGQVGIGVAGGTDIHVTDNIVLGKKRDGSNVAIYVWNQTGGKRCSDVEVRNNTVDFRSAKGVRSAFYNGGGCGTVQGLSANDFAASLPSAKLAPDLTAG